MPDERIDQKRPAQPESDLRKMQQRLVDETVDESFPASDPPAWTTTGAKSVAAKLDRDDASQPSGGEGSSRARWAMDEASRLAQEAYRRGADYVGQGRDYLPRAGEAVRTVARPVGQYPLAALMIAGAVGYGLAWLIHGRSARAGSHDWDDRDEHEDVPYGSYQDPYTYRGDAYSGSGDSPKPHGDKLANVVRVTADEGDRY